MIVGAYILNLYCDAPGCIEYRRVSSDTSARDALKAARKSGWTVNTRTRFVRCPKHKHFRPYLTNAQARERSGPHS